MSIDLFIVLFLFLFWQIFVPKAEKSIEFREKLFRSCFFYLLTGF